MSFPRKHYERRTSALCWLLSRHAALVLPASILRPAPRWRHGHARVANRRTTTTGEQTEQIERWLAQVCELLKKRPQDGLKVLSTRDLYKFLVKYFPRTPIRKL
jgi:hypothetical protein